MKCNTCGTDKPTTDFYKNKAQPHGYRYECKDCLREYTGTDIGKALKRRYRQSEGAKKRQHIYWQHRKDKHNALAKVGRAVKSHKLPNPKNLSCHFCNMAAFEYHHHLGYEYPLAVIPVCKMCHVKVHKLP